MTLTERIIALSLRHRYMVLLLTALVAAVGVKCFIDTPIDAFPDVTNTKVTIITQWPGRSAEEVEKFVSLPIEIAMSPVPRKTDVRSTTLFGLSVVTVVFDDHANAEFARQQVYNMLASADLPDGVQPEVQPLYGPTGEIFRYTLSSPNHSVRELKELQDWVIERRLRGVDGVADIVSFGGEEKTFEVSADPNRLAQYGISAIDLYDALSGSNVNVGGDIIERGRVERRVAYVVRGIGLLNNVEEIGNVVVRQAGGVPILVRHVAEVRESCKPRLGQVGRDTTGDVVEGIVVMRRGENTDRVLSDLKQTLAEVQRELPDGVTIDPFYDRAELVQTATRTVLRNVLEGILLVTLMVLLFMRDWRTTVTVASVIPLALLFSFICLRLFGMNANLLSLGAIDFGIIIDGAVVMVEGLFVMLSGKARQMGREAFARWSKNGAIRTTAKGKARAVAFSKLIIILALLPIFSFQKVEGKMFSPLAFTLGFALLGALLFSLTLVPALSSLLLGKGVTEHRNRMLDSIYHVNDRLFGWLHRQRRTVLATALPLTVGLLGVFFLLGNEFLPSMDEGSIYVRATMPPDVALSESVSVADRLRSEVSEFPQVSEVLSQAGRPNDGTDATGFFNVELFVKLHSHKGKAQLIEAMNDTLETRHPGIDFNFSQPISDNVEEAVSGVKGSIVVKIYGNDLERCERQARLVEQCLRETDGIEDVGLLRSTGQPELRIELDESRLARYGVEKEAVQRTIEMAIGGKAATQVYEGERKFDLMLRYDPAHRSNETQIGRIRVPAAGDDEATIALENRFIPISELATITTAKGPLIIYRDHHRRYCAVKFSVRGRDMGGAVREAQRRVAANPELSDADIVWTGDFENQQRASRRLGQVLPISLLLIFLVLYLLFGNARDAALVLCGVPAAAAGGLLILWLTGMNFSISAGIGFICLFGICIQNGVIMLGEIKQRIGAGTDRIALGVAVDRAQHTRLRAILMTALMATLGLLPAALSTGIGSESQRPLAVVIIGGLFSATFFILFIFPLLVEWVYSRSLFDPSGKLQSRRL